MARIRNAAREERGDDVSADSSPGDNGAGLVFWLLIALAVATFAPCMILPAWREYQLAELTLRVRTQQVEAASAEVERLEHRLDAIHNDPAVVARLAQRELEYRQPGDHFLAVVATPESLAPQSATLPETPRDWTVIEPPLPVARVLHYLPDVNYDRLFCSSPFREIFLGLSVVLFVAAFAIFWPRVEHEESEAAQA